MNSFVILSGSLSESTLWAESNETRILFITMLTRANKDGIVYSTVFGLSHIARLPIEATEKALAVLESPDTKNPQQEFEGRRIQKIDDGWRVLNYRKYIEKAKALTVRAYKTKWARESRARGNSAKLKSAPLPGEPNYQRIMNEHGQQAADAMLEVKQKLSQANDDEHTPDDDAQCL